MARLSLIEFSWEATTLQPAVEQTEPVVSSPKFRKAGRSAKVVILCAIGLLSYLGFKAYSSSVERFANRIAGELQAHNWKDLYSLGVSHVGRKSGLTASQFDAAMAKLSEGKKLGIVSIKAVDSIGRDTGRTVEFGFSNLVRSLHVDVYYSESGWVVDEVALLSRYAQLNYPNQEDYSKAFAQVLLDTGSDRIVMHSRKLAVSRADLEAVVIGKKRIADIWQRVL